jgi:hypothetical protein
MPTFDMLCKKCDSIYEDVFFLAGEAQVHICEGCGAMTNKMPALFSTPEYGGPQYSQAAGMTFGSRSEEKAYWKNNGFTEAGDKVGGARNEDHLHTGKIYSGKGLTRRGSNPLSK